MNRPLPLTIRDLKDWKIPEVVIQSWIDGFNRPNEQFGELNQISFEYETRNDYPLTTFQSYVLSDSETLEGLRNLLVTGPTSAGKTLIAEAIVATTLARNPDARILYLVPLRSLVTEKWLRFQTVFETPRIVKEHYVVPLSSDYPASDYRISKGQWQIAIAVFEKVYRWLADEMHLKDLVEKVDLVIVDELQVIEEAERGEKLEMILSIFLWLQRINQTGITLRPRIVALAASGTGTRDPIENVVDWLDAVRIPRQEVERPIRLYEGRALIVFSDKRSRQEPTDSLDICVYSNPRIGHLLLPADYPPLLRTALAKVEPARDIHRLAVNLAQSFVSRGLRVLMYVATKGQAQEMALSLRKKLQPKGGKVHDFLVAQLDELDDSPVKDLLTLTLQARVGFHHGDMTPTERMLVEYGFRQLITNPPISIVVGTPTLSMGVNLPADIVIMRDHYTFKRMNLYARPDAEDDFENSSLEYEIMEETLSTLAYRNFAGRAGRNRPSRSADAFGLALLLGTQKDKQTIDELLVGKIRPLTSQLTHPIFGYHPHVLTALSVITQIEKSEAITDQTSNQIFALSYAWKDIATRRSMKRKIEEAFHDLRKLRLIDNALTGVGQVAVVHHLSYESVKQLLTLVDDIHQLWPRYPLDLFYRIAGLPELQEEYPRSSDFPGRRPHQIDLSERTKMLMNRLRVFLRGSITSDKYVDSPDSPFRALLEGREITSPEELRKLIRSVIAWEWIKGGHSITQLGKTGAFPKLHLGPLKRLGERFALYISALRNLYQIQLVNNDNRKYVIRQLWLLEQMLRYGVPPEVVPLPVIVSYAANRLLTGHTCVKIFSATEGWLDARSLIGLTIPENVSTRTWEAVQQGLVWWVREAETLREAQLLSSEIDEKGEAVGGDFGMMLRALEDLSTGRYTGDLAQFRGLEVTELIDHAQIKLTPAIYSMFQFRAHRHLERISLYEENGLYRLATSMLEREPLSLKLKLPTFAPRSQLWILEAYDRWLATVVFYPDKPTQAFFSSLSKVSRLIVICSLPPVPSIQVSSRVALLITIEALTAASEFIIDYPKYRQRLFDILADYRGVITSVEDMLSLLVLENLTLV